MQLSSQHRLAFVATVHAVNALDNPVYDVSHRDNVQEMLRFLDCRHSYRNGIEGTAHTHRTNDAPEQNPVKFLHMGAETRSL